MANLSTTITESVTINGRTYGRTVNETISGINDIAESVVSISTASTELLDIVSSNPSIGDIVTDALKYFRITNTDSSNFVTVTLNGPSSGSDKAVFKLLAGQSFVLNNDKIGFGSGFVTMDKILVQSDTAACDCEIFIATT